MIEYLIGTGGWAYFHIPGLNSLAAYSRAFNFVEVNSTFYQMPQLEQAERWRRIVPPDFQFSVRAYRSITHKYELQPDQEALEDLAKTKQICGALGADILHLQTPPSFKPSPSSISGFRNLISSTDLGKLRIALEVRGVPSSKLPTELINTMQDFNMVHCVDVSKGEMPAYESDVLYSRLFGKGEHNKYQPTDGELAEMDSKILNSGSQKMVMSFHFVRMYKDAARLKIYKQTGKFPQITGSTGLESLEESLSEDAKFPTTKQELINSQGWKLFDVDKNERVHASNFLQKLPEKTYKNIGEIVDNLQAITG